MMRSYSVIASFKNRVAFVAIVFLAGVCFASCLAGCRTVAPVHDLRSSSAPDVSRVMLKNGDVIVFNEDFGWYNQKAGTIEGVTTDTPARRVEYHLTELSKVETVRTYSLAAAFLAAGVLLGFGIYLLAKLLAIV